MPISSFTPVYEHGERHRDVMGDWRARTTTGALSACDAAPTTAMFGDITTYASVDESFYSQQQWTHYSGGSTCLNDATDRYARNMTSFGVPDVTITNDVSKCDVRDERLFAGQYRYSPTSVQKLELSGQYGDGQPMFRSNSSDGAEAMSYESLQNVLQPCKEVTSHSRTTHFTSSLSVNDWHGETTESDTGCDVICFRQPAPLIDDQLITGTVASTYELVDVETQPAVTSSNYSLRSYHQMKRCDSQLHLPAAVALAAADTSLMQLGSESDKRLSERERIKRAKHNGVEKRRRSNINEHMKALDSLLPRNASGTCKSKQNKGNILKETVAYIRVLQQDQARLVSVEQRTRQLYTANRHIIARLKELEELLSTSDCSPRVSLGDFGLMADDLDAYIKQETSYAPAVDAPITSRTGDDMITCSL